MKIRIKSFAEVSVLKNGNIYTEKNWPYNGTEVYEATIIDDEPFMGEYDVENFGIFLQDEVEVVSG